MLNACITAISLWTLKHAVDAWPLKKSTSLETFSFWSHSQKKKSAKRLTSLYRSLSFTRLTNGTLYWVWKRIYVTQWCCDGRFISYSIRLSVINGLHYSGIVNFETNSIWLCVSVTLLSTWYNSLWSYLKTYKTYTIILKCTLLVAVNVAITERKSAKFARIINLPSGYMKLMLTDFASYVGW